MDMHGEHRIPAPRQTVWEALNEPDVLKACIPGCESLDKNEAGDGFDAKVKAKVGPVKATFSGSVKLENVNPPESYTIAGEGKGGAAGFAKGSADVQLAEDGDETILSYQVKAQVGGKLAQLGARLIDSTAKKYANDFFSNFAEIAAERAGKTPPSQQEESAQPDKPAPEEIQDAAEAAAPSAAAGAPPPSPGAEPAPTPREREPEQSEPAAASEKTSAEVDDGMKEAERDPTRAAIDAVERAKQSRKGGLSGMSWVMLVIVAVLILLALFSGLSGGEGG
ncbi:MAG: carbon monoxide dehydrogenase subunit G [Marivibrio sp.]|uniref:SRPBCC family protein n=1 Tax=Marivibrio sp. TaxID=2039719 RepID=UPI0032EB3B88